MEEEMTNMSPTVRRSPIKRVPHSPLSRHFITTMMGVGSRCSKMIDIEKGKYEQQVTVLHVKKGNNNEKVNKGGFPDKRVSFEESKECNL